MYDKAYLHEYMPYQIMINYCDMTYYIYNRSHKMIETPESIISVIHTTKIFMYNSNNYPWKDTASFDACIIKFNEFNIFINIIMSGNMNDHTAKLCMT